MALGSDRHGLEGWLALPAVCTWASPLISLSYGFLICKVEMITLLSEGLS